MRKDSKLDQSEIFVIAGCIGAQAIYGETGFRQRDLKFLIEMVSNWVDFTLPEKTLTIHNTQVMRYLTDLVRDGYARIQNRKGQPSYKLTGIGLITLVSRMVHRPPQFPLENFYFVYHFLTTYRPAIEVIVQSESKQFPGALKLELDSLLNIRKPLETHIQYVELEVRKLKQRIADSQALTAIIKKMRQTHRTTKEITQEIEKQYPYDLNSQKPLAQFFSEIPENWQNFIVDSALQNRAPQMWIPAVQVLERHAEVLNQLKMQIR